MRGRLIFPLFAEIYRLDRPAMALWGAIDPDFREPLLVASTDQDHNVGELMRIEMPVVRVPCQVENQQFERLQLTPAGNAPISRLVLIFHFRDLEVHGLVDEHTGNARIQPGDRLGAIVDRELRPQLTPQNPPGLFVSEVRPSGFGLGFKNPQRNLLHVSFEAPDLAVRGST